MTTGSTQHTERWTRNNAVPLLVDHQVGLYTGVRDFDILQLKHNVVGLTRAMLALKVPVVVTMTTEKWWGPLFRNSPMFCAAYRSLNARRLTPGMISASPAPLKRQGERNSS